MATIELSGERIEDVARTDLPRACELARELVAANPYDEDAAKLLRDVVERLAQSAPPRPDPDADLPAPLIEAATLLSAAEDEAAEIIVRQYAAEYPNDARAMAMMAEIAARCEFFDDAQRILTRALQVDPDCVDALLGMAKLVNHLSFAQISEDRGEEALTILRRALEIDPTNIHVVSLYSSILVRFRRVKDAIPWYDRLLKLDPTHWLAWSNYAILLNGLGEFGQSIAALRTTVAFNPKYGLAWWEIANLKVSKLFDSDIERMEELLSDPTVDPESRGQIHFALAKAFDQAKRFEDAAEQLKLGNAIKRELEPYDTAKVTSDVANSEKIFTPAFFKQREGLGDPRPDPIFIIGMQRAGTTLVEQILSSHSQVEGTEELFYILQLGTEISQRNPNVSWQLGLARASERELADLGGAYLKWARHHRLSERPLFIDKNPANWRFAGLIATILPNAKIIDVRRNPMDCCFANYTQHYNNGVGYSYSLADAGLYYSDYVRLMRHFADIAPGRIHKLLYDDLVDDLEANVRRLLDYVGLPFEESCLRFYDTDRPVLTPSSQQVRQPINRKGFGRWRSYEPWLGDLQDALGDTLDQWRQ
ncbi:sulfotransferase [Sphingomonas sp.]|uniref:tetratricopeptide repeat-containing sulfotransferase family protein n=1 Tax=Sphingomonas sp. TaxID=28214 RepID=UPI0038A646A8